MAVNNSLFNFDVGALQIERLSADVLPAGNRGYIYASFRLSPEWHNLDKIAVFQTAKVAPLNVPVENGICQIPDGVMAEPGTIFVSVFAGDLRTTNMAEIEVIPGGIGELPETSVAPATTLSGDVILSVLRECRNYFIHNYETGAYSLEGGQIAVKNLYVTGQYVMISDAILASGVYRVKNISNLTVVDLGDPVQLLTLAGADVDEDFGGKIYGLKLPRDFLKVCRDIQAFVESKQGKVGAYTSETVLGVHTWSKATNKNGMPAGWQELFAAKLAPFKRMFTGTAV
jgi:hypothetical protein